MRAKARRVTKKEPLPRRWTGSILDLQAIGNGISGMVLIIDEIRVIKVAYGSARSKEDIDTERKAYSILGHAARPSPHILRYFELNNPQGIVLERCHETVRHRLMAMPESAVLSDCDVRKWSEQAAEGLAFVHGHEIIHADVGCHNMLLDFAENLKLCDFAGSSVRGSRASTVYEIWSRLPSKTADGPTTTSDLFALGSAIYELSTKERPYYHKPRAEVRELYMRQEFPPIKNDVSLKHVIIKCWTQKYVSAADVVYDINPRSSMCCGHLEGAVHEPTLPVDNGVHASIAMESSLGSTSISISKASDTEAEASESSCSTSLSWLSISASSSSSSSSKSSSKSLDNYNHDHDKEHKQSEGKGLERGMHFRINSKQHKKPTKRKLRNRHYISQRMNKPMEFNSNRAPAIGTS